MSVKSSGSHDGPTPSTGDIIRSGVLKKMKTARKKYFVLRAETPDTLARLEYYDSEKKFRNGIPPKRCIPLKTCFDINKRQDTKHKHVIALYTKDDCFCIVLDNEDDLKAWLKDLLILQHDGEIFPEGEAPKPKYESVWQVQLCERGLGGGRAGMYRLCLTDRTITLVKIDEPMPTVIELSLASVRSCGNLKSFFFLEVGRSSNLGAGEFWFEADDTTIASNIQTTVSHHFKLIREKAKLTSTDTNDIQPKGRTRSSSATESSKPKEKKFNVFSSKGSSTLPQDNSTNENNLNPSTTSASTSTTTGFRERCDSMPSRPRTTSEGANHGKPYLVPHRSHLLRDASRSPPTGSPISPPSDSTGSSYSLPDEHDGPHDMEHQRIYTSTLTPDEVIAEEDCPESPRANPSGGNYVPMNFSGILEKNYTDMSHHVGGYNYPSNSESLSSVTSGTPSTDIRFSDYPLDKVCSYVSADDDDARPCRAYSVGSKPPDATHQLASTPENSRVRAFSVGSKSKKFFNRVLQPHHQHVPGVKSSSAPILAPNSRMGSSHGSINNPMDDLMEMDFSSNGTSRSRSSTNASGSSEARASANNRSTSGNRIFGFFEHLTGDHNKHKTPEGYVEMKPGGNHNLPRTTSSDVSPYVDMTQGQRVSAAYMDMSGNVPAVGHIFSPYMDMSGNAGTTTTNPQVSNGFAPYMDMSGNNANSTSTRENYMDMSGSSPMRNSPRPSMSLSEYVKNFSRTTQESHRGNDYNSLSQTRRRANSNSSTSHGTVVSPAGSWNNDYMDMSGPGRNSSRRSERASSFSSQMSSSPNFDTASPKYSDFVSFGIQPRIPEVNAHDIEGYVQMTPGDFSNIGNNPTHQRQSSIDSMDNEHGDYLNMSGNNLPIGSSKFKSSKKERSQPISIQTTSSTQGVKNSSPLSISSLLGHRMSPTNSPKMHLPLSPYSSLPRQKSPRKSSQAGSSKDSSSVSSSVTTTPSGSSTMFPLSLNSPSSPLGSSKSGTPTTSGVKIPSSVLNVPYKSTSGTVKKVNNEEDYAMMDFEPSSKTTSHLETNKTDESPYMNYCPPGTNVTKSPITLISKSDDSSGDYAIMKPGTILKSTTLPRIKNNSNSTSGLASPLATHLSSVGLNDKPTMCFRPIKEKDERMSSPRHGDQVPDKLAQDNKSLESASMEIEEEGAYDVLRSPSGCVSPAAKISRPNSSNSDKIKISTQRPASTSGTEKNSRPSSVCSEGLASRLGSNSSVYSSSSSTSTVVGMPNKAEQSDNDQASQSSQQMVRLHYASLDLSNDNEERRSPRTLKNASSDTNLAQGETTFVYADIDFIKSEELNKNSSCTSNSATVKN